MRIEPERAIRQLRDALDLLAADDPRRPKALSVLGQAHQARAESRVAADVLEAAARWYVDHGNELAAAELATQRGRALINAGRQPEATAVLAEARTILEAHPGPGLIEFFADRAFRFANHYRADEAIEAAENALRLADELGLPPPYGAFQARGMAIGTEDVPRADQDMLRAVELAMATGDHRAACQAMSNRPDLFELEHSSLVVARYDEVVAFARRYGLADSSIRAHRLDALEVDGRWDELLEEATELREDALARGDGYTTFMVRMQAGYVEIERGAVTEPLDDLMATAESVGLLPFMGGALTALAAMRQGDHEAARAAVEATLRRVPDGIYVTSALELARTSVALGDVNLARRVLAKSFPFDRQTTRGYLTKLATAFVLEAEGNDGEARQDFAEARAFFEKLGWPYTTALAQFGEGRCLIEIGDRARGVDLLRRARDTAIELNAKPTLLDIEAAMDAAGR